jgi:hypothetical protein
MHPSFKTTSSRQNQKQNPNLNIVYINLFLINFHTGIVPIPKYEINIHQILK